MDSEDEFGNNRIEDISWLCSLSESELDMLISIKQLALKRGRIIGREDLYNKFDLKLLRSLGFTLMEHCRGQLKEIPELCKYSTLVDRCNLLDCNQNENVNNEEIKACISIDSKKRRAES